jgi:hypothetical protein
MTGTDRVPEPTSGPNESQVSREEMIPACAWCMRILDPKGGWQRLEDHLLVQMGAKFSHTICPECLEKFQLSRAKDPAAPGPTPAPDAGQA